MRADKVKLGFKSTHSQQRKTQRPLQNNNFEDFDRKVSKREYISSADDLKKTNKKARIVIPAQPNTISFSSKLEEKAFKELTAKPEERRYDEQAPAINSIKTEADGNYMSALQSEVALGEDADYAQVPIESFGMGMLLGMGWDKNKGIGRTFRGVAKIQQPNVRPAGLGLGANLDERGQQTLVAIGEKVKITEGKHQGKKGVVTSLDVTNVRVTVELKDGNKIDVSELCVNKIGKNEDYTDEKRDSKKDRYKNDSQAIKMPKSNSERQAEFREYERENRAWLTPDTIVRVVDQSSQDFKSKFSIRSVVTPFCAMLDNGKEYHQAQLDTVIPKENGRVCIIKGEFRNCIGRINKKNKKKGNAMVEFWDDNNGLRIHEFTFFEITEAK